MRGGTVGGLGFLVCLVSVYEVQPLDMIDSKDFKSGLNVTENLAKNVRINKIPKPSDPQKNIGSDVKSQPTTENVKLPDDKLQGNRDTKPLRHHYSRNMNSINNPEQPQGQYPGSNVQQNVQRKNGQDNLRPSNLKSEDKAREPLNSVEPRSLMNDRRNNPPTDASNAKVEQTNSGPNNNLKPQPDPNSQSVPKPEKSHNDRRMLPGHEMKNPENNRRSAVHAEWPKDNQIPNEELENKEHELDTSNAKRRSGQDDEFSERSGAYSEPYNNNIGLNHYHDNRIETLPGSINLNHYPNNHEQDLAWSESATRLIDEHEFIYPHKIPGGGDSIRCTNEGDMYYLSIAQCLVCVCVRELYNIVAKCARCSECTTPPPQPIVITPEHPVSCAPFPTLIPFENPLNPCQTCICRPTFVGVPDIDITCENNLECVLPIETTTPNNKGPLSTTPYSPYDSYPSVTVSPTGPIQTPNSLPDPNSPMPWPPVTPGPIVLPPSPLPGPGPHESCTPYPLNVPFQHPWDECQTCLCNEGRTSSKTIIIEVNCFTKMDCCIEYAPAGQQQIYPHGQGPQPQSDLIITDAICKFRTFGVEFLHPSEPCKACTCDVYSNYVVPICKRAIRPGCESGLMPLVPESSVIYLEPTCRNKKPNQPYTIGCQSCYCTAVFSYVVSRCEPIPNCGEPNYNYGQLTGSSPASVVNEPLLPEQNYNLNNSPDYTKYQQGRPNPGGTSNAIANAVEKAENYLNNNKFTSGLYNSFTKPPGGYNGGQSGPNPNFGQFNPQSGTNPNYGQSNPQSGPNPSYVHTNPKSGLNPNYVQSNPQSGLSPNYGQANPQGGPNPNYAQPNPQSEPNPNYAQPNPQNGLNPNYVQLPPQSGLNPNYGQANPQGGPNPNYAQPNPQSESNPNYAQPNPQNGPNPNYVQPTPQSGPNPNYAQPNPQSEPNPNYAQSNPQSGPNTNYAQSNLNLPKYPGNRYLAPQGGSQAYSHAGGQQGLGGNPFGHNPPSAFSNTQKDLAAMNGLSMNQGGNPYGYKQTGGYSYTKAQSESMSSATSASGSLGAGGSPFGYNQASGYSYANAQSETLGSGSASAAATITQNISPNINPYSNYNNPSQGRPLAPYGNNNVGFKAKSGRPPSGEVSGENGTEETE